MRLPTLFKAASLLSTLFANSVDAQQSTFTHTKTGVTFVKQTITTSAGTLEWGYALPATSATATENEYIGYIKGPLKTGRQGYSGISHGYSMVNHLLLVAWAQGTSLKTEFLFSGGFTQPVKYAGDAKITKFSVAVTDTSFELVYRCENCWSWNHNGVTGSNLPTDKESTPIAWAQHSKSYDPAEITQHDSGQSIFTIAVPAARNAKYSDWAKLPPVNDDGTPISTSTSSSAVPTSASPTACVGTAAPTGSWDYIVVGGGAGGIPVADKLSEAGKKVLLIEKGPPSLGRFSGTMGPDWLKGSGLTRFDVPGLCNQIWVDAGGIACSDTDQMAGCVLGGGAAVNAALWWKPNSVDWDFSFPNGWKASEMSAAVGRTFQRIAGTDTPSSDGKLYKQEGYNVLSGALSADGWTNVKANDKPNEKHRTFSKTPYMYANGQRQGPLGTYLVTAKARSNFKLWTNTAVKRVIRTGGKATGVELEAGVGSGGYCGNVTLNAGGRVILSAGTFGTAKLLFRSGIGPKDQLNIVKGSVQDGKTFIPESQWINLPVGQNLNDHVNTDLVIKHKDVSFYDFYQAWDNPIQADKDAYLNKRAGILTQSAPNIGPVAWEVLKGTDGVDRQFQWTARVEGPGPNDTTSMTLSNYLGRGSTSRGVASINGGLTMAVTTSPYLRDKADTDSVIASLKSMVKALQKNPQIEMQVPPPGTTIEAYVASLSTTPTARRANHWIGTAKIGADSGLNGGTSVVDLNTKVYGTDNIFVVDASIFPAHITTNPTSYIVAVAEQAAAKILALK